MNIYEVTKVRGDWVLTPPSGSPLKYSTQDAAAEAGRGLASVNRPATLRVYHPSGRLEYDETFPVEEPPEEPEPEEPPAEEPPVEEPEEPQPGTPVALRVETDHPTFDLVVGEEVIVYAQAMDAEGLETEWPEGTTFLWGPRAQHAKEVLLPDGWGPGFVTAKAVKAGEVEVHVSASYGDLFTRTGEGNLLLTITADPLAEVPPVEEPEDPVEEPPVEDPPIDEPEQPLPEQPPSGKRHSLHVHASTIDYRIHYRTGAEKIAEYDFAASKYDSVIGGHLSEYRNRNPNVKHFVYDLLVTERKVDAGPMETWLAANGHSVEAAYLHKGGTSKANRIATVQWNSERWIPNPGNPGFRAWRQHETKRLVGQSHGIMFDEFAVSTMTRNIPFPVQEYTDLAAYLKDLRSLLVAHRQWIPAGFNILNSYQYWNKPDDIPNSIAAGGVLTEFVNSPFAKQQWDLVDHHVAQGVTVEFATGVSSSTKGQQRNDITPGNYGSIAERVLMWEYASYLMVVNPQKMDAVTFETYGLTWSVPHSVTWLTAFEYPIGLATAKRAIAASGTDSAGQSYQVYQRRFENAVVLIRAQGGQQYGNQTAVTVPLPSGSWRMLRADGSLASPASSAQLRNSEALVFVGG